MCVDLRLDRCVHHETVARAGTSKYGTFEFEGGGGWGGGGGAVPRYMSLWRELFQ